MVPHWIRKIKAAEPALGEVEMHLLTKPAFGPDAKAISDKQHAPSRNLLRKPCRVIDQQFLINPLSCIFNALLGNGWTASVAVGFSKMWADTTQLDEAVNRPQQVVLRHMIVDGKLIKECALRFLLWSQHRQSPCIHKEIESVADLQSKKSFSIELALRGLNLDDLPIKATRASWVESGGFNQGPLCGAVLLFATICP
jgi:hypothetical protein